MYNYRVRASLSVDLKAAASLKMWTKAKFFLFAIKLIVWSICRRVVGVVGVFLRVCFGRLGPSLEKQRKVETGYNALCGLLPAMKGTLSQVNFYLHMVKSRPDPHRWS